MSVVSHMYAGKPQPIRAYVTASSILKVAIEGPWIISATGLQGDEQADLVNHGGLEKALHHYPFEHYAAWRVDLPHLAPALAGVPAFGENISTSGMTEADIFVGDIYRIGAVIVQVSQGRQPCWKLNARFSQDDMSYRVQKTGRTCWYYRVLQAGQITAGDTFILDARPQPEWPLSRIISLLYQKPKAFDELAALSDIPELAEGWRNLAAKRVRLGEVEDWHKRLKGDHGQ